MEVKIGKFEVKTPLIVVIIGAFVIDNVVANICKTKSYKARCEAVKELGISEEDEEEES